MRRIQLAAAIIATTTLFAWWVQPSFRASPLPASAPPDDRVDGARGASLDGARNGLAREALAEPAPPAKAPELRDEPTVATAPLRGRVLDTLARNPVPFARITIEPDAWSGATDDRGRFCTDAGLSAGERTLRLPQVPFGGDAELLHDPHVSREHEVIVRAGPTFLLRLHAPDELDPTTLTARLSGRAGETTGSAVRLAPRAWTRIAWEPVLEELPPPWFLELSTEDGAWFGRAEVRRVTGFEEEPLEVRLFQPGSLAGTIRASDGGAVGEVQLRYRSSAGDLTDFGGHEEEFELRGVPPGHGKLVVRAAGFAEQSFPVLVEPGETSEIDLLLSHPLAAGTVEGRVASFDGRSVVGTRVILYLDHLGEERQATVEADGRFVFPDVPAVRASLEATPLEGSGLRSADREVTVPAHDILLRLPRAPELIDGPPLVYVLRAVDASTGEPIQRIQASLEAPYSGIELWSEDAEVDLDEYPQGMPFRWALSASGYATAYGDESDFARAAEEDGSTRTLEVRLRKGWAVRLRVRDASGNPVPGVRFLLDDQPGPSTDEEGLAYAHLPLRPRSIGVAAPYELAPGGRVHPESGAFGRPFPELDVVVRER